ncbi:MAG: fructosamine kinase family protein, partial [Chloroflexota bacterium]
MIPPEVQTWLSDHQYGTVLSAQPVQGGCINQGAVLKTQTGDSFFLKTHQTSPADMFSREVAGLDALRVDDGPKVPKTFLHGPTFLLMEDLAPAPKSSRYWPSFGRKLARLHQHSQPEFGFAHDNYIGSTPQPNKWTQNGFAFFAEQRLHFQAKLARERGLISRREVKQVEKLNSYLPDLIPQQPASLLHGDLWSGNATADCHGGPAIIDPAAHFGWAESELAMTTLFGAFPAVFYHSYEEVRPLPPGYRARFPIYNLYHLL